MTNLEKIGLTYVLNLMCTAQTHFDTSNSNILSETEKDAEWSQATEKLSMARDLIQKSIREDLTI